MRPAYVVPARFARPQGPHPRYEDDPVAADRYSRQSAMHRAYCGIMDARLARTRIERIRELNWAITWTSHAATFVMHGAFRKDRAA